MNKNYSPGPWSLEDGKRIHDVKGDHVADVYTLVWHKGMEDNERQEGRLANARLISAAPDLVEALQAQIRETQRLYQLTKDIECKGKASAIEMYDCIVDEAIDALTKAGVLTKEDETL